MPETNRKHRRQREPNLPPTAPYPTQGHPSVEQLMVEQGTGPILDVALLHGDFWPEEESIEDFLATLHDWRGHRRRDPAL